MGLAADAARDSVVLRGGNAGLEVHIDAAADADEVALALAEKLEESPGFFSGGNVTLRYSASPPPGALAPLESVTTRFDLRIIGVVTQVDDDFELEEDFEVEPVPAIGSGQAPLSRDFDDEALEGPADTPTKMLVGPIRSGCVLEVEGHLIVVGDINPGAEVRAKGSIVVLGRLRGIAHAACAGGSGFIVALSLSPQQLRVGELVARAGDSEAPGVSTEIAYASGGRIVVETFSGKLPFGIATAKL